MIILINFIKYNKQQQQQQQQQQCQKQCRKQQQFGPAKET